MKRVYAPCPKPDKAADEPPTKRTAADKSVDILQAILKESDPCDICKQLGSEKCDHKACPICLEVMEPKDIALLSCNHPYCRNCIQDWVRNNMDKVDIPCPVCKQTIVKYHHIDESRKDSVATVHFKSQMPTILLPPTDPTLHMIRYHAGDRVDRMMSSGTADDDDDDDEEDREDDDSERDDNSAAVEDLRTMALAMMLQRYSHERMNQMLLRMRTPAPPTRTSPRRPTGVVAPQPVVDVDEDEE